MFGKLVQRLWRNFFQTIIWCPVAKIQATFGNTNFSKKPVRGPFQRCSRQTPSLPAQSPSPGPVWVLARFLLVPSRGSVSNNWHLRERRKKRLHYRTGSSPRPAEGSQSSERTSGPLSSLTSPRSQQPVPISSSFALPFHWLLDELNWNLTPR